MRATALVLSVMVCLLVTWTGTARAEHEGGRASAKRRALNRAETEFHWDELGGIEFPCADEIKKWLTAKKTLPTLSIEGENHTTPYCQLRSQELGKLLEGDTPSCVCWEKYDFKDCIKDTADRGKKQGVATDGLEDPRAKALILLLSTYEYLANLAHGKGASQEYGQNLNFLSVALDKKGVFASWFEAKHNLLKKKDLSAEVQAAIKIWDDVAINNKELSRIEKIPGPSLVVLREYIRTYLKDLVAVHEKTKADDLPKDLANEIEHALDDMEALAKAPTSAKALKASEFYFDYLVLKWRDRLMARNLAQSYCANLKLAKPRTKVFALVGQLHMKGMASLLRESADKNAITLDTTDGALLEKAYSVMKGTVDEKTKRYPDQGLTLEKLEGVSVVLAKQTAGARIALLMEKWDPLDNTPLGSPGTVRVFGDATDLKKQLGLDPKKPFPPDAFEKLGRAMFDEFRNSKAKKKD